MKNEELLQCPLLQGLDTMRRAELLGLMKDSNLREKVEKCVAGLPRPADCQQEVASLGAQSSQTRNVQNNARSWNRDSPSWRRSAKE